MSVIATLPKSDVKPQLASGEQRLLLGDVSWDAYLQIGEALRDRPALRMTYDRGSLDLITTSPEHEILKKYLGRLIETLAEEHGLPLATAGNMTFQRQDLERGLEADDCYWIAHEPQVRGRLEWDPKRDPPPDLALEIEVSRSALNRMGIYAALGVPEVWRFDGETMHIHRLQADGTYQLVEHSPTFPRISPADVIRFAYPSPERDFLATVRAFRDWVRARLAEQ